MTRGEKYLEKKDYSRAILEFQNAARLTPLDAQPYYQLGLVYLEIESPQLAVAALKRAVEIDPSLWQAELKIAELLSDSPEPDLVRSAEQQAGEAMSHLGWSADGLNALATAEWKIGKKRDAEYHLREAFARFPSDWNAAISLAKIELSRQNRDAAELTLKNAAGREPSSANLALALGEFYLSLERYGEGRTELQRAATIDPHNSTALLDLAALATRNGQTQEADALYRRISALPQSSFRPLHALFLAQSGKFDEGIEELRSLYRRYPADRNIRSYLVSGLVQDGKDAEAERFLNRVLKDNPADTEALFQISSLYLREHKTQKAMDSLMEVIRVRPDVAEAHYLLAQVYRERGATLSQKPELEDAVRLRPDFLEARVELCRYLLRVRSYLGALDVMDKTPAVQKQMVAYIEQRNWALFAMQKNGEAQREVSRGLAMRRTPTLLLQKAILNMEQHDLVRSRAAILEALQQTPDDVRGLNLLMASYRMERRDEAGIAAIEKLAANSSSPVVHQFLGDLLLSYKQRAAARQAYEAAVQSNPRLFSVQLDIARMDIEEGRMDDVRKRVSLALAADSRNSGAKFLLGWLDEGAREYAQAEADYAEAIDADPSNVQALNNLGFLLATKLGKPTEALKYAQKAKELAPYDPEVSDTLGWIFYEEGLYESALPYLRAAVAADPSAPHRFHLAMAFWKAGDRAQAQETFSAAMRLGSNSAEALEAKRVLSQQ